MALVAGVDSSTQSCKVVVRDADTGALVRSGRASHPDGTVGRPRALVGRPAVRDRGRGRPRPTSPRSPSAASSTAWSSLDADGAVVRDALLWNDTRSADAALDLDPRARRRRRGGRRAAWADAVGSVPSRPSP